MFSSFQTSSNIQSIRQDATSAANWRRKYLSKYVLSQQVGIQRIYYVGENNNVVCVLHTSRAAIVYRKRDMGLEEKKTIELMMEYKLYSKEKSQFT